MRQIDVTFLCPLCFGRGYKQATDNCKSLSGFSSTTPTLFSLIIYLTPWFLTQHVACSKTHLLKAWSISFSSLSAEMWAHSSPLLPVNWQPTPNPQTHVHIRTVSHYFFHSSLPRLIFWKSYSTLLNPHVTPKLNSSFIGISHSSFPVSISSASSHLSRCISYFPLDSPSPSFSIHPLFSALLSSFAPLSLSQCCFSLGHQVSCTCS